MASKSKGALFLPPASLQLLVPPVRLMSAFVWRTIEQQQVLQYDKLLDFISLLTESVPELLSAGHKAQLLLGLRAKVVLELCRGDGVANLPTIQSHLDKMHACGAELSAADPPASADILKTSYTNFASLIQKLLSVPLEKELFFQDVFPVNYGSSYDQRLQQLVSEFLSRLEKLLPVPDLQQTTGWLSDTTSVCREVEQHLCDPSALNTLLLHHRQMGTLSSGPSSTNENLLLSTLALPVQTCVGKYTELFAEDDDCDSNGLTFEDLEEDSDDWTPKKKSGPLSRLFVCPQCSFAHRLKTKVQRHIQTEHRRDTDPVAKTRAKTRGTNKDCTDKRKRSKLEKKGEDTQMDGAEEESERVKTREDLGNKRRRRHKGSSVVDKRFLSTRQVNKDFTEEETKCRMCAKVFQLPNQLKTHMKLHTFPYSCVQCEKGFTSSSGYYQHQRVHKRGRTFMCSRCHKGFLCRYALKQHERLHDGPTNPCNVCGKNLSKSGFTRHVQMHKGERNYLCTACGKSFLSSGELLQHSRTHTGETPHTCTLCGKGFSSKSHLTVHVRSHTGDRPYLCSECPKRFLTLNCLKRHTFSHNGVKPFACPNCSRQFSQQGNLKRHLATHKLDSYDA